MKIQASETSEDDSLRAEVERAFTGSEEAEEPVAEVAETPDQEAATETTDEAETAPEKDEEQREETEAEARARDEQGRFAKQAKAKQASQAAATAAKDGAQAVVPQPADRAPQSLPPALREKWKDIPPEFRAHFTKRDREITTALNETAPARKFAADFQATVAPYQHLLGGADPLPVVKSFFNAAHQLASPNSQVKAQAAAHLIKAYSVDIEALAAAIEGGPAAAPQGGQAQPQQQFRDPRVDQMLAQQQAEKQRRDQAIRQDAEASLEKFKATHEYFEDVRLKMAHLHDVMTKDGLKPTAEELYTLACQATPEVAAILKQRGSTQANAKASTQRARAAASSIRGQPAPAIRADQRDDVRSAVEAAFDQASE